MDKFTGFAASDFETFLIDGLDERMKAIQERIQPKFYEIGEKLVDEVGKMVNEKMYLHVAKHARRSVNPPNDTWMAVCHNKRGYKKHPHFQVGLFDDHVFIWLAFIYELPNKTNIARRFIQEKDSILEHVPKEYLISLNHMKKDAQTLESIHLDEALKRFHDVKKAEFLIGRHIPKDSPLLKNGDSFLHYVIETFQTLTPLYQIAMK